MNPGGFVYRITSKGGILAFLMGMVWLLAIVLLVLIAEYICQGIGIMRLSAHYNLDKGWLGFIPIASNYQIARIANITNAIGISNSGFWLHCGWIGAVLLITTGGHVQSVIGILMIVIHIIYVREIAKKLSISAAPGIVLSILGLLGFWFAVAARKLQ